MLLPLMAYTQTLINGIYYYLDSSAKTATVTKNPKTHYYGDIEIPNVVVYNEETYRVTSIGDEAFNNSNLKSISIPNTVTSIGARAFFYSTISSITIPNSVTSIGRSAFSSCVGLTSVTIPNSVTSIGEAAFHGCTELRSAVIGSGVTSIGYLAFPLTNLKKTIWLTSTPPSGYKDAQGAVNYVLNEQYTLGNNIVYPFLNSYFDVDGIRYVPVSPSERTCDAVDCVYNTTSTNTKIKSTVTYNGVTMYVKNINPYLAHSNKYIEDLTIECDGEIAEYAFTDCSKIKTVKLGQNVSAIGKGAFGGCSSLEAIDIPEIVTTLSESVLSGCSSLKKITIKPQMTDIKNSAFYGCTSLKDVIMEDGEAELNLGYNNNNFENNPLFSSCPLDYVYIGRNINYETTSDYNYSPFYRNTSLREVIITDKETEISENEFYGCTKLQGVSIGNGVTNIGNWAFSGCMSLKSLSFGSQLQTIGKEAFYYCKAVTEISSKATTPPVCGDQALDDINKWESKLVVPKGAAANYQATNPWKDFYFIEEREGSDTPIDPDAPKCATPTIDFSNGKLVFNCSTEGAEFVSEITDADVKKHSTSEVELTMTYNVSVYAKKEGLANSDVATKQIVLGPGSGIQGDVNGDGIVTVTDAVQVIDMILRQQ